MNATATYSSVRLALLLGLLAATQTGCGTWLWKHKDRTSIITPPMRVAAIREFGPRGRDADAAQQQKMCEQLAAQIRMEPDPIVRKAVQETIAEFKNPLADAVLKAGLQDDDRFVRMTCCRKLGERADAASAAVLGQVISADADFDVRLAAVDALGKIKSPDTTRALAPALKDRDPAMQYAAVQSMKSTSAEDLGNDVAAWRQFADKSLGNANGTTAVAQQPGEALRK